MTDAWREATREELHTYYTETFPNRLDALPSFATIDGPKQYAIAFREAYPIRKENAPDRNFIRRDTWQTTSSGDRTVQQFESTTDLIDFIQYPARYDPAQGSEYALAGPGLLNRPEPRPDAVYYALDHWERPWVLAVDIDAKDIAAQRASSGPTAGEPADVDTEALQEAGILDSPPEGYPYAFEDIEHALEYGFTVRDIFEDDFAAQETMVVYSGQGCHVYLLDTDREHRYDAKSREVINDLLLDEYGVPIDPVVTADRRRVMRLPYSLHADVSRVVQPIDDPGFDFRTEATPDFLNS
ncbi:DNA primase [Haloarcula nitratireducens]|uniref:DNA primase n=1 Tax=Haloarcula nitratireducens TaxID=2487749 RepID=A0AAW4PID6_9EURY|nr:DNA primase [Halomicroarcula nitratireducens]MBX0297403.1 DNA primase [Halomicroarcula nitratireducens]